MRFRLKTDFITYARDQIRGGLWYKPSWWEAVQNAPPTPPVGRIRKREIPHIRFVEDKLVQEFTARNPALKRFDDKNVAAGTATHTVAAQFVTQQLHLMRNNVSADRAYQVATAWLLENGHKVLSKADPKVSTAGEVPDMAVPPVEQFNRVMAQQSMLLDTVLASVTGDKDDKFRGLPPYRDFRTEEERAAITSRAGSTDVKYPVGYTSGDEGGADSSSTSSILGDPDSVDEVISKTVTPPLR